LKAQELKFVPSDYYFPIGFRSKTMVNIIVTVGHLTIEKGVIFPDSKSFEFVSKIEIKLQTTIRDVNEPYITIWVNLDRT
jgi:hypothetical protein